MLKLSQEAAYRPQFKAAATALWCLVALVALTTHPAWAATNLLVNPSFEQNAGHTIPTGWTRFAPPTASSFGDYWVETTNATVKAAQDGILYFKEWGACYDGTNNAAGIYQDLGSAPSSTYQASGWFYTAGNDTLGADCYVWIEVLFLGSSSNLLALYKSATFTASVGTDKWFQYQVTNACDISSPVSIGDPFFNTYAVTGTVSQVVAPAGTTTVRYRFVYVQYLNEGGSCYLDSAALILLTGSSPPVIGNLFPLNMIFVNPNDGLSFTASSPSGYTINTSGISVVLNGVNVSPSLTISGSASSKTVSYSGLQSNTIYNASISVTDVSNLTTTASSYFETTWVGVQPVLYIWEAEDFNFSSGMFYDSPVLCNTPGTPNCYFGTVGVEGVDEHNISTAPSHQYRPSDAIGTVISGDYNRKDHSLAGVYDYRIDPFIQGMWLNYTRDWTNGTYWVVGRLSTDIGLSGTLTLGLLTSTATNNLGTFTINGGRGWSAFENIYLKDANGNNALVTLNGKQTLRLTSGGNLLPNFFMLVVAEPDLPILSNVYPDGTHPFEPTNTLSFTVTASGSSFPANGITLNLDGFDVTSNLVLTGSASTKNVVYPYLLSNAIHVAVITATNVLGHGIAVTNHFDTFSEQNNIVEAEDFDYGGGQYIADWVPDAYADYKGPFPAVTNIDFQHAGSTNDIFHYRAVGIPQEEVGANDWLRADFVSAGAIDYDLVFFVGGDWANYTRNYPAGSYFAYIRTSGGGPFSMSLDQVISGAGTANQVTSHLGRFYGVGQSYTTFAWAPLTDDGMAAPVVVKLNGVTTLRLTTGGNCNPNYFMFVPASGIALTARRSAGNTVLSFPSQTGVAYRLFYKTNLSAGNWTLLTTVLGNGAVESVNDGATGARRFYKVVAP